MSVYKHAGTVKGIARGAAYIRDTPQREARNAEARVIEDEAKRRLSPQGQKEKDTEQALRLEQMEAELKSLRQERNRRNVHGVLDKYNADGDPRHLNQFLQREAQNPNSYFKDVARFEPLQDDEQTRIELEKQGLDPDIFLADDDTGLRNSKVRATLRDGRSLVYDLDDLGVVSQWHQDAEVKQLQNLKLRQQIKQGASGAVNNPSSLAWRVHQETGKPLLEVVKELAHAQNAGKPVDRTEQAIGSYLKDNPQSSYWEAFQAVNSVKGRQPADVKKNAAADDIRSQLEDADFFSQDLSDDKVRRKFDSRIQNLKNLIQDPLSDSEQKTVRNLRNLVNLGGEAGDNLTEEQAGLMDRMVGNIRNYTSNDVEPSKEAVNAYEQLQNSFRNAMFGLTLTKGESQYHQKASGTLYQKLGPALTGLKQQMEQVRNDLVSISQSTDMYVMHYELGMSRDEVDNVISALDERLSLYRTNEPKRMTKEDLFPIDAPPEKPTERPSLDQLFPLPGAE